jgi:hypothetical protein
MAPRNPARSIEAKSPFVFRPPQQSDAWRRSVEWRSFMRALCRQGLRDRANRRYPVSHQMTVYPAASSTITGVLVALYLLEVFGMLNPLAQGLARRVASMRTHIRNLRASRGHR